MLHAFLVPTARALHDAYPRQFRKLLRYVKLKYVPLLKQVALALTRRLMRAQFQRRSRALPVGGGACMSPSHVRR